MDKIQVGLIGYGIAGSVFHAPLIRSVAGLELAAVVTSRPVPIDDVRVVGAVEELLADPSIDVVVVATPTSTHFEVATKALHAGKHVVVDKPVVTSAHDADVLIALAEERGRLLTVYQNRRFDGDFLTIKQLLAAGELGNVAHYEAHYDRFRTKLTGVWREQPLPGSGILYDLGAHLIDQCLVLFGRPRSVNGDVLMQREGAEAVDYFHLLLDYGFLRVILHSSMIVPHPGPHFTIHGDGGSFFKFGMDPQEAALKAGHMPGEPGWGVEAAELFGELYSADGSRRIVPTLTGGYENFYVGLAAAIRGDGPAPVDPRDSRDGLVVIEGALRSASERRTVELEF